MTVTLLKHHKLNVGCLGLWRPCVLGMGVFATYLSDAPSEGGDNKGSGGREQLPSMLSTSGTSVWCGYTVNPFKICICVLMVVCGSINTLAVK